MAFISKVFGKKDIISVNPEQSVFEAAQKMTEHKVGSVVVLENETLRGIFTERDLLMSVVAPGKDPKKMKISEVMSINVCTIGLHETVEDCYRKMHKTHCRHLPIMEGNKVVGMISVKDLIGGMLKECGHENEMLKDFIQRA